MFCSQCGSSNENGNFCSKCGAMLKSATPPSPAASTASPVPPKAGRMFDPPHANRLLESRLHDVESNMVWAILVTLFCCQPFGIVAIVYSAKVADLVASGDYARARDAAANSRKWCKIGAICWVAGVIIYTVIFTVLHTCR